MFTADIIQELNGEIWKSDDSAPKMEITENGSLRIQFSGDWGEAGMDCVLDAMASVIDLTTTTIKITWEEDADLGIGMAVAIISKL